MCAQRQKEPLRQMRVIAALLLGLTLWPALSARADVRIKDIALSLIHI